MPKKRTLLQCFGLTDLGLKRTSNQDHFAVASLRKRVQVRQSNLETVARASRTFSQLLVVADGMGGMAEGGQASRLVVETLLARAARRWPWAGGAQAGNLGRALHDSALACRRRLLKHAAGAARSMGTTLTAAHVSDLDLDLLHVGDSRCYLLRRGKLKRLTTDHTMAQRLAAEGALSKAQAAASPFANVLWNSISSSASGELKPEVSRHRLQAGDVLLLCTDGLTKHLDDKRLAQVLKAGRGVQQTAEQLVAEAREKGGTDNITVIVAALDAA